MGTQFWWFYDILLLCVAGGTLYAAIARGFNKGIFRLVGFVAAMILGVWGSGLFQNSIYESLFREGITTSVETVLADEEWQVFDNAAEALALADTEAQQDAEAFRLEQAEMGKRLKDGEQGGDVVYSDWFVKPVCDVIESAVSVRQKPHAEQPLSVLYADDATGLYTLLEQMNSGDIESAASALEKVLYRPSYLHIVRIAMFLLIQFVVLIICVVVSVTAGNLEQQMHIRKGNHVLAIPIGLLEVTCLVIILTVLIWLMILLTDGQMLLINTETIEKTILFKYIYYFILR